MGYTISRKAEDDILQIYIEGTERFGVTQAERYHQQLEEIFEFLAENPRAARERLEISPPVRFHPFQSHLVVYFVDEHEDIFIIRVRHSHEDWQNDPF